MTNPFDLIPPAVDPLDISGPMTRGDIGQGLPRALRADVRKSVRLEAAKLARPVKWRDMATAPKDGTLVRLLVNFEHHATEDTVGPQPTIGSNTWDNHHDFDVWQFAGWSWEQDCYTQGVGTPVGWLPMLDDASDPGQLDTLNDDLIAILGRPNFTCIRIAQALRLCGVEIKTKAEHEQAAVIHFLLMRYLRHGSEWATHTDADLRTMLDQAEAKNKAAMGGPLETGEGDARG